MKSPQTPRVCLRSFALITILLCSARYAAAATETLFTTQVPQLFNVSDGSTKNRELGTRFTSRIAGHVTAIRFWKASRETGLHVGHVWNASGQLLASVNFVNETASGWQQQSLATPLAVNANTVYVVSVNTGNTYYVTTHYSLATKAVNQDLSSVVGNNGVFGSPGQFPSENYESSNYFRDVLFSPNTAPGLTSNPVSLNFANVNVGSSNSQTVTLTNTSSGTLSISRVAVAGTGFSAGGLTVPLSLAKGSQLSLKVSFTPTVMGTATGSVTVTSNASNPNLTVTLSGVGMAPQISAVPTSVAFGSVPVGVSNTQTLTLKDSGNANLIVSQTTVTGTGFSISGPALPATVTPGNSIALTVRFSPGIVGTTSGTVGITDNATPLSVPITGTGISQSLSLSANPSALAFGNVSPGSSSKLAVTLTNTGNSSINLSKLTLAGNYFSLGSLALPVTLATGQSSGFTVTFAPTTTGTFSGSVSVTSTAANSPLFIALSGTGAAPHYVTLSWIPSTSVVSGYSVYRGTQKGGPYTKITSSLVAGSTYDDASVQSGSTYHYVVSAVASDGVQSVFSSETSATIP
jgi:Domain of unknown function (DUF4082)/Abnormal spindle-like microcephaly-assoc'd, ASPM-SPD-2-Hydin